MIQIVCDRCGRVTNEKSARIGVLVPYCGNGPLLSKGQYWRHGPKQDLCRECLNEEKRKILGILIEHPNLLPNSYLDDILDNIEKVHIEVKE